VAPDDQEKWNNLMQPMRKRKLTAKATTAEVAPLYEPTPEENSALQAFGARTAKKLPAPRLKVEHNDSQLPSIRADHNDHAIGYLLLANAVGTTNLEFLDGLLSQISNVATQGPKLDEPAINFMLAVIKELQPRDEIEAMLAAQMSAVHMATMTFARRLAHVENIPQQDSAERAFNKLTRTFTAQVEALKRYRTGGEQKVTVQHVTVNEGGQAVVGNISSSPGRGRGKPGSQA
jgi:hypothetical protein